MSDAAAQDITTRAEAASAFGESLTRSMGAPMCFAAGDVIFRQGDPAEQMFIVIGGSVEILVRERVVERLGPGRTLGVVSLVDRERRNTTARAAEECELAVIEARVFRIMVEETPNFVWYIMRELVARLRATTRAGTAE
jgi:CRP/FNR family transcriptional regulator, cyclic AMP receptor protein